MTSTWTIESLLLSHGEFHLSAYVTEPASPGPRSRQLMQVIEHAEAQLRGELTDLELQKFLAPLRQFEEDMPTLAGFESARTLALFRTRGVFRAMALPIEARPLWTVASSFHVKPLLKWRQHERGERAWFEDCLIEEWQLWEKQGQIKSNLFQIARAAVRGDVRHLVVAEDRQIFGHIDESQGGLSLHPCDLNAYDDDVLDDLAQLVLRSGGQVSVKPQAEIPGARAALAFVRSPRRGRMRWQRELARQLVDHEHRAIS